MLKILIIAILLILLNFVMITGCLVETLELVETFLKEHYLFTSCFWFFICHFSFTAFIRMLSLLHGNVKTVSNEDPCKMICVLDDTE